MTTVKFGLSTTFPCGYLEHEQERLLVYIDEQPLSPALYSALQSQGFRRSEDQVYKPHCQQCNACQSIRLPVSKTLLTRSQKRLLKKASGFHIRLSNKVKSSYYPLYEQYINQKHKGGVMYPASPSQLESFTQCTWMPPIFIELYDNESLIAVAITDSTPDSLSAVYTFYAPDYAKYSLGTLMILQQINLAKQMNKSWLYLGYFIEQCEKMSYKTRFSPYQIRIGEQWHEETVDCKHPSPQLI
ncbi:MAG: arginyltransferase [Gammaproteobacteria bacterium]|nr:arginyltransferase [Gammaproteobacteria bacterium]